MLKWELEVLEKKHEDRFTKIETNGKKNKQFHIDNLEAFKQETIGEFENIKNQFEAFGSSIYDKVANDLTKKMA